MQKKTIILLLVEAIIFLSILFGGYYNMSRKLDVAYQNIETYKGDIDNLELKNGELISIRDSYIMDKKEIQEELDITKKQYKELEKLLDSKIAYISKLESTIQVDSVVTIRDSIVYVGDEITNILFTYNDDWIKFVGESDILEKKTTLYDISIDAPLTIGLTDNYQLFVKSPNPYIHFSSIDGYVVDESKLYPKKQKWSWGLQGGFGALYGLNQKQFDVGFYLGIGVEKKF